MKRYFKYRWNESRGDEYDNWGFSNWYNEFDEDFFTLRVIQVFDNGNILKYSEEYIDDEFGMLPEGVLIFEDLIASGSVEISQEEFESVWTSSKALNE